MDSTDLRPLRPVMPAAAWLGGKRLLADLIAERLALIPHKTYAEPFIGMGGVFFRRPWRSRAEVINDVNRDLVTLFRVLQRHAVAFTEMLRWQLSSRAEFERLQKSDPSTLTDMERAARFLYLQRTAFGGKPVAQSFGVSPQEGSSFDVARLVPLLTDLHERLSSVTIECLGYSAFISRYDRAETLFYLDPPYWGCEGDYGKAIFDRTDFQSLATQLAGIAGKFVLSINDVPEIRELFKAFRFEEVKTDRPCCRQRKWLASCGATARWISPVHTGMPFTSFVVPM